MYPANSIPTLWKGICTDIAGRSENPKISKSGGVRGKWNGFWYVGGKRIERFEWVVRILVGWSSRRYQKYPWILDDPGDFQIPREREKGIYMDLNSRLILDIFAFWRESVTIDIRVYTYRLCIQIGAGFTHDESRDTSCSFQSNF